METLKRNLHKISDDTEILAKDYLKLFSVRQSEKLALFLGILTSVFVLATLLLILVVFSSFALAGTLNKLLVSDFWGFVIVGGLYLLAIILLIVKIFRSGTPLFANLFVKLIVAVLNIDSDQPKNIKGLRKEGENIRQKIKTDKTNIETDFQLLRYKFMSFIFQEIVGLFTSRRKVKEEPVKEEE
jgi:energy-coupling factor transporter transmembrane protein EcfT